MEHPRARAGKPFHRGIVEAAAGVVGLFEQEKTESTEVKALFSLFPPVQCLRSIPLKHVVPPPLGRFLPLRIRFE
jgi:hypothetical protein